ncbi:hypothetical protein Tco_0429139 [Tanacetum coccineum]
MISMMLRLVFPPRWSVTSFFVQHGLANDFFESINNDPFSGPQWVNLFQIHELVYRELVREFFALFEFKDYASKGDSLDDHTKLSMQHALPIKTEDDWRRFWPNIGDSEFAVGSRSLHLNNHFWKRIFKKRNKKKAKSKQNQARNGKDKVEVACRDLEAAVEYPVILYLLTPFVVMYHDASIVFLFSASRVSRKILAAQKEAVDEFTVLQKGLDEMIE